jgi:maltose O-acetyltransferase
VKPVFAFLYFHIAQHLPRSYDLGGRVGRLSRAACLRRIAVRVGSDVNIEPRVLLQPGSFSIGDRSGVGEGSRLGAVEIGEDVIIGPEIVVISLGHRFDDPGLPVRDQGSTEERPVRIDDGSWIGTRVIILPGVRIGRNCVVGAGSVVTRDVPDGCVTVGNPARIVRDALGVRSDA